MALWGLVVVGAFGGIAGLLRSEPAPVEVVATPDVEEPPTAATGAAELAVKDWLSTGVMPGQSHGRALRSEEFEVLATAVIGARLVAPGYWAVVVVADIRLEGESDARWFVEVGMAAAGDGFVASGLPAIVPSPSEGFVSRLAGPTLRAPRPGDAVAATVEAFLRALLAGSGDLDRYLAPGIVGPSATPALFVDVTVDRIAEVVNDRDRRVVRTEVTAAVGAGVEVVLSYEVTLVRRDDQWDIESWTGAPTLAVEDSATTETSPSGPALPSDGQRSQPVAPAATTQGPAIPSTSSTVLPQPGA